MIKAFLKFFIDAYFLYFISSFFIHNDVTIYFTKARNTTFNFLRLQKKESTFPLLGKAGSAFLCLAHLLITIFSCTTSTNVSFLHLGQYSGNFMRTVSSYTFVRVFPPQFGQ